MAGAQRCKFCEMRNLRNESDVEQNFMVHLLDDLGFSPDYRLSKSQLPVENVGKANRRRNYVPDFVCFLDREHRKPVLVVDAKAPQESALDGVKDAQLYASVIRRRLPIPKPEQYCMGSNGHATVVRHFDSDNTVSEVAFAQVQDGDSRYEALKSNFGRRGRAHRLRAESNDFEFKKPDVNEVRRIFEACHDAIWKRDFKSPAPAFWEFCKLMFVKLAEDKRLHHDAELGPLVSAGLPLPGDRVVFSMAYISRMEASDPNPLGSIFSALKRDLEREILEERKKRIFNVDERLELKPATIRKVVEKLEHLDLYGIDEDLNGRLFQTFLGATMRGPQLGQFFTPRTVVEFMCDVADLEVSPQPPHAPLIIDACCGSGGFLIEAMAKLTRQLREGPLAESLTQSQRNAIERAIKDKRLVGIDAGTDPPVARIARINMYLHGDGGSRIFAADALDKQIQIPRTADPETRRDLGELRSLVLGPAREEFDIALTNPPFSMKKEAREPDQRAILETYELAWKVSDDGTRTIRPSLKSNVMFLERYYDLLRPGGTLLSVIDESVLNTGSHREFRQALMRRYEVLAVFSLPQHSFTEAGANVKTSVLVLRKKPSQSDAQPPTFFGRSTNIGYDEQRLDESKSDLPALLEAWRSRPRGGTTSSRRRADWAARSVSFTAMLEPDVPRLDFEWHDPRHFEMKRRMDEVCRSKGYVAAPLREICDGIRRGETAPAYVDSGVPILKVRNVTGRGINWDTDFVTRSFYDSVPQAHLARGDVLVTATGLGTIGRVDQFDVDRPCMVDGHIAVLRVTPESGVAPDYLVQYLRSPFGQTQMERFTVGCTGQMELSDPDLPSLSVLRPGRQADLERIMRRAARTGDAARRARDEHEHLLDVARVEFEQLLGR